MQFLSTAVASAAKAAFDDVYDQPDPRPFFRRFAALDYRVPGYAASLLSGLAEDGLVAPDRVLLDVCCSYGQVGALVNHDLSMADLYTHYASDGGGHDPGTDERYFNRHRHADPWYVVGLDVAPHALRYGESVGLLHDAVCHNLETSGLGTSEAALLRTVSIVHISGGIGYVGPLTLDRILRHVPETALVAGFVLRWLPTAPVANVLSARGFRLHVDRNRIHPQRRFADGPDRVAAMIGLRGLGIAATAVELRGYHGAVPFVAARDTDVLKAAAQTISRLPDPLLP